MECPRCVRRWRAPIVILLTVVVAIGGTARPAHAAAAAGGWSRPVDGPVVRPFEQPSSVYGPGHRGVDFAVAAGTPVRAANDGVVSFAGTVAGTLHVTIAHAGDLRTSYSFLSSVLVRAGQVVERGDVVGLSGGAGADHDGSVLHLGLRIGERYVDPMVLFRPGDLTKLVRLVPAEDPRETPWSAAGERRDLQLSLHLPAGAPARGTPASGAQSGSGGDDCGGGIPLLGGAVDAVCDVGGWLGDGARAAVDAGIDHLGAVTDLAASTLDDLRAAVHGTIEAMQALSGELASAVARTPAGQLALDVVEMGRRFVHVATAECSGDAPGADGSGGSTHRLMVVAGINSAGPAWNRGPTVDLDVEALGYRPGEGEVRYFSYAPDGGPYAAAATHGPIEVAAMRLGDQLRAMQREQPGREVDLIAHSQGGLVADWFLGHLYDPADRTLPPLGNVVTLSSPHEGAPLATAGRQIRSSAEGRTLLGAAEEVPALPPPSSRAVRDLAEGSPLVEQLWDQGVPEHVDFTTIGATEDIVVPATQISVPGATETVAAVNDVNQHRAILRAPDALRAVRAALEGRPPPCVGLVTALRTAVAPVVISRVEHTIGSGAAAALGASG